MPQKIIQAAFRKPAHLFTKLTVVQIGVFSRLKKHDVL